METLIRKRDIMIMLREKQLKAGGNIYVSYGTKNQSNLRMAEPRHLALELLKNMTYRVTAAVILQKKNPSNDVSNGAKVR